MSKKLSDEEIVKKQERLYEQESSAFAGPPITEEEQMRRIDEVLSGNFRRNFRAKVAARKEKLEQEIAHATEPEKKTKLRQNLEALTGFLESVN